MNSTQHFLHDKSTYLHGYWSGNTIQLNQTDEILILDPNLTTSRVINHLYLFRNQQITEWLNHHRCFRFGTPMIGCGVLRWEHFSIFDQDRVLTSNAKIQVALTYANIVKRLGSDSLAEQLIRQTWQAEGAGNGLANMRPCHVRVLPEVMETLLLELELLRKEPLTQLLSDLLIVHNADDAQFIPEGFNGHCTIDKKVFAQARDAIFDSPVGAIIHRLAPPLADYLLRSVSPQQWSLWLRFKGACSQWLLFGALQGKWLMPQSCASFITALSHLLPQIKAKRGWDTLLAIDSKYSVKQWLARMYCSSTLRDLDDTPTELFEAVPKRFKNGPRVTIQIIKKLLDSHRNDPPFPYHLLNERKRNFLNATRKYSPDWAKENLSAGWWVFFKLWHKAQPRLSEQQRSSISYFLQWCQLQNLEPINITPRHLHNVHNPKDKTTYSYYLRQAQKSNGNPSSNMAAERWQFTSRVMAAVANISRLPEEELSGSEQSLELPLTLMNPFNAFEGLEKVFKQYSTFQRIKTPRSRMLTEIQEALIEELLGFEVQQRKIFLPLRDKHGHSLLDEDGHLLREDKPTLVEVQIPTFSWAKKLAEETPDNRKAQAADWFLKDEHWKWNPSTAVALALLLLTPLRSKQVRWLDQGLLDANIFDYNSGRMVVNTHILAQFKYANGENHEAIYGSASGVLQLQQDEFSGALEPVIWSSTNKTAMWDGCKKTGYALPWPDGSSLLFSDNPELQKCGRHLARVYEVLNYQYSYMAENDPNPGPLTFYYVPEDRSNLPSDDELCQHLPWFVPLCRQIGHNEVTLAWPDGTIHRAAQPVFKGHIETLYTALCLHVERKLCQDKRLSRLTLTVASEKRPEGYKARYDLHSLRVAGISRLIELGIPAHMVSEFIAGHQSVVMTMRYFQTTPMYMRKKLLEAFLQGDLIDGFEAVTERLIELQSYNTLLPAAERVRQHAEDLPLDFAALAPVPGGLCLMGGKGSHCDKCSITTHEVETKGQLVTEHREQLGGCAGGRFYRTGPDFILQQALEANKLMLLLRRKGRERKIVQSELKKLSQQINSLDRSLRNDSHNTDTVSTRTRRDRLMLRHSAAKTRLAEQDEALAPLVLQWYQRWKDFIDSQALATSLGTEFKSGQMVLIGDSEQIDYSAEIVSNNDFGLARTVLEQALCYVRTGQELPEDYCHLVKDFLNRIMREEPELLMLFNRPRPAEEDIWLTSTLASLVTAVFGDEDVQSASEGTIALKFDADLKDGIEKLCENSELVPPDLSGRFSNLQKFHIKVIHSGS